MKFYELRFKLISPACVTFKRTERGFLSTLNYIPASTLRGALISGLYWRNALDEESLRREAIEPRIISSPAYPCRGGEKAYPCHPFAYECKIPHGSAPEDREIVNYMSEELPRLISTTRAEYRTSCSRGHIAIAPLHPNPVIPSGNRLKKVSLPSYRTVSVGMSKRKGSSERGMLFEYECISAGQEFWSTLAVPEWLDIEEGMEFAVGRGVSRGLGRAKLMTLRELSLDESAELVKEAVENGRVVLYSLSRTLSIVDGNYRAYPPVIDLERVAERAGINAGGRLRVYAAYGRTGIMFAGWDMVRNEERPTFSSAGNSGSILVARLEGEGGEALKAVAALGFLGTVEMAANTAITGVNMLVPIKNHPMVGEGG